jgi:hypothetical protein
VTLHGVSSLKYLSSFESLSSTAAFKPSVNSMFLPVIVSLMIISPFFLNSINSYRKVIIHETLIKSKLVLQKMSKQIVKKSDYKHEKIKRLIN